MCVTKSHISSTGTHLVGHRTAILIDCCLFLDAYHAMDVVIAVIFVVVVVVMVVVIIIAAHHCQFSVRFAFGTTVLGVVRMTRMMMVEMIHGGRLLVHNVVVVVMVVVDVVVMVMVFVVVAGHLLDTQHDCSTGGGLRRIIIDLVEIDCQGIKR